ncbi:MAG: S9 family peptidase [Acidobacteria bacterium]|nr:S9 family peptidase [Acidobacteriota bacterium]
MKSEQLPLIISVSAPTISPKGDNVVAAVSRPDFDGDCYVGQLVSVPLAGGRMRRLTRGHADAHPVFSPDGTLLAFLRTAPEGKPQLHVVNIEVGEPLQLTDAPLGVSSMSWAPDSRTLVYSARVPEEGRYGSVDGVGPGAEDARLISTYQYRMNGAGYTRDKYSQLFLVTAPDLDGEPMVAPVGRAKKSAEARGEKFDPYPKSQQLTHDDADHGGAHFSADGARVLFTAGLQEAADTELVENLYSITLDGKTTVCLTNLEPDSALSVTTGTESADGKWLFYIAADSSASRRDFVAAQHGIYVAPIDSLTSVKRLTGSDQDFTETQELTLMGDDGVLAIDRHRGERRVVRATATGEVTVLTSGPRQVTGVAVSKDGLIVSYQDSQTFGDLGLLTDGELTPLTDLSQKFRARAGVIQPVEREYAGSDGYPVHGWVLSPEGPGPHPVLLNIHGGPFADYGWGLFDEAQVYAAAGYAVVMCNPRGAAGYGYEHGRVIKEAMGTVDLADVLTFLEGAQREFAELDETRVGIMGGSYGGYLTAWTIAHDHRFVAAIVERGFLDPESFVGSSDIGWFFSSEYAGNSAEQRVTQSPMAVVGNVKTPTLVIHSEQDLRCPIEQGQRYYTALKQQGVDTELLVFPGESHELSRAGTPHHRKQRFDEILSWWARYLPSASNKAG